MHRNFEAYVRATVAALEEDRDYFERLNDGWDAFVESCAKEATRRRVEIGQVMQERAADCLPEPPPALDCSNFVI